jgi:hypothetical protein
VNRRRSIVAVVALSLTVLTACGASAPPADELGDEMIDTLDVSDEVKACMHEVIADFEVSPESGFTDLDDVAQKASDGQPQAMALMDELEADLTACN